MKKGVNKKGAASTMQAILLMVIVLAILVVFIAAVARTQSMNTLINMDEFSVMKLGNTFSLTNRSLGMTWYVFAAQSVFDVTDTSVKCGIDDDQIAGDDIMPDGYWYYYDTNDKKGGKSIKSTNPQIPNAMDFVTGVNTYGNPRKYNDFQPAICYPRDKKGTVNSVDVSGSAIQIMEEKFADLKEKLMDDQTTKTIEANGIKIEIIPKVLTGASEFLNGNEYYWSEFAIDNNPVQPMVNKTNKQTLKLSGTAIVEETENNNTIYTEFPKMMDLGRLLVSSVFLHLSDPGTTYISYHDINSAEYDTSGTYMDRIAKFMKEDLIDNAAKSVLGSGKRKTKVGMKYNELELRSSDQEGGALFGLGHGDPTADDIGLILSYDVAVTMREGTGPAPMTCAAPPEEYAELIKTEVALLGDEWEFGSIEFSEEDIMAFVKGLIKQESEWRYDAVSCAGAVGLGQLMPDTAKTYELIVPEYSPATYYCGGARYAMTICNLNTPANCDKNGDDRFDPEKNIRASVKYINDLMDKMDDHTEDGEELMKLAAASYNCGPSCVKNAITKAVTVDGADTNDIRFDDIAQYIPGETQEYVPKVLGGFVCYGGTLSGGDFYYYHDEDRNKFIKRPFSMTVKARDDLVAIDCYRPITGIQFFSWQKQPTSGGAIPITTGDMMCCGGKLWSCNANIPKLDPPRALSTGQRIDSADSSGVCSGLVAGLAPPDAGLYIQCDPSGFRFYANNMCPTYSRDECKPSSGCYWYTSPEPAGSDMCVACSAAAACPDFKSNKDECNSCAASGQACEAVDTGKDASGRDTWTCKAKADVCSSYGIDECKSHDDCYWYTSLVEEGCFDCRAASSCSDYGTNEYMCSQCKANGLSCRVNYIGTGDFFECTNL